MKRVAVLGLAACAALAATGAGAQVRAVVTGTVRDVLGNAVEGARVTDGRSVDFTDGDGRWSIVQDPPSPATFVASKAGHETASQTVVPLVQSGDVEFALKFAITPTLSPTTFSAVPQTLSLMAHSLAPAATCVTAIDDRAGDSIPMEYGGTDDAGVSTWLGAITVPASTSVGFFHVSYEGRNCSTLVALTDRPATAYVFDRSPPQLEIVTPVEGRFTIGVAPLFPTRDGSTRVFGPVLVQVDAIDDLGLGRIRIDITPPPPGGGTCSQDAQREPSFRYTCGPYLFVFPGTHMMTVRVTDVAGKTTTGAMELVVPEVPR